MQWYPVVGTCKKWKNSLENFMEQSCTLHKSNKQFQAIVDVTALWLMKMRKTKTVEF